MARPQGKADEPRLYTAQDLKTVVWAEASTLDHPLSAAPLFELTAREVHQRLHLLWMSQSRWEMNKLQGKHKNDQPKSF